MSRYEYNKGVLTPTTWEDIKSIYPDIEDDSDLEWDTGQGCVKIKDLYYKVSWKVKAGEDAPELINLRCRGDGSLEFETYHYNGGAHWTELLEDKL